MAFSSDRNRAVFFALFFALVCAVFGRLWIVGDGVSYYAWARSAVFDHDLDFDNEYHALNTTKSATPDAPIPGTTRWPNYFSVGPALIWLGPVAVIEAATSPFHASTGYELPYVCVVALSSLAAAFAGLLIVRAVTSGIVGARASTYMALLVWLGTPLLHYLYLEMSYAHLFSFFFSGAFLFLWLQRTFEARPMLRSVCLGIAGGLMTLMRWQDALFMLLPAVEAAMALRSADRARAREIITSFAVTCAAFAVTIAPQLLAWRALYGEWLVIPQGSGFLDVTRWWRENQLLKFLFSARHGLFMWHPLTAIGFAGVCVLAARKPRVGVPLVAALVAQMLLNAATTDWWAGYSFGSRRMISALPIFAVGVAVLVEGARQNRRFLWITATVLSVLCFLNILFWIQYRTVLPLGDPVVPYTAVVASPTEYVRMVKTILREATVSTLLEGHRYGAAAVVVALEVLAFACVALAMRRLALRAK